MKKVLVTGATGFIGQPLTRALLRRGWTVTALVRRPEAPEAQALAAAGVRLAPGDQVVADGRVVRADGLAVDEANLTGESEPAVRGPGEPVWSGSFAVEGAALFDVFQHMWILRHSDGVEGEYEPVDAQDPEGPWRFKAYTGWFQVTDDGHFRRFCTALARLDAAFSQTPSARKLYARLHRALHHYIRANADSWPDAAAEPDARRGDPAIDVRELAGELLRLYAQRQQAPGTAFELEQEWLERLEASFPYQETPDRFAAPAPQTKMSGCLKQQHAYQAHHRRRIVRFDPRRQGHTDGEQGAARRREKEPAAPENPHEREQRNGQRKSQSDEPLIEFPQFLGLLHRRDCEPREGALVSVIKESALVMELQTCVAIGRLGARQLPNKNRRHRITVFVGEVGHAEGIAGHAQIVVSHRRPGQREPWRLSLLK